LHDAIFSQVAIAWAKQEELVLKKFSFFYNHDLSKVLFTSMC